MTKAQLLTALAALPDDAKVFIAVVPHTDDDERLFRETIDREQAGFGCASIIEAAIYEADGPYAQSFACLEWNYSPLN